MSNKYVVVTSKYISAESVLRKQNELLQEWNVLECANSSLAHFAFYQEGIRAMANAIVAMIDGEEDD